jgi:CRP-like cAMP-binding protein
VYDPATALQFFQSAGKPYSIAQGEKIFAEAEKGIPFLLMRQRMYLLLEGEVSVVARNKPIAVVKKGEIFGEMATINQAPRSAAAVAKTPCRVIALDDKQFVSALGKQPDFALMLMSVMVNRLRDTIERIDPRKLATNDGWKEATPLDKELVAEITEALGPAAQFRYGAGKTIVREGQFGVALYIVLDGRVSIRIGDSLVEKVGPGGVFGEMALVDRSPRLATAVAEADCSVLAVSRHMFLKLVKQNPRFGAALLAMVSDRARAMAARSES